MEPRTATAGEIENKVDLKHILFLFYLVLAVSVTVTCK
jgi:hypothetical protein